MNTISLSSFQADIIVIDPKSRRAIGRPWITIAFCKSTKMIVGSHVSLEMPSADILAKCLAHAILPKNVSGMSLLNEWPCEGIPRTILGSDDPLFRSPSLQKAVSELGVTLVYDPSLKKEGATALERFFAETTIAFRTMPEAAVWSFSRDTPENSKPIARLELLEFEHGLTRWIVDDYHVTFNAELGCTPLEAWRAKAGNEGPQPYDHDAVRSLRFLRLEKRITKLGIQFRRQVYFHRELVALRESYGVKQSYDVRFDPQNPSSVVLGTPDGRWITLQNDREIAPTDTSIMAVTDPVIGTVGPASAPAAGGI